MAPPQLFHLLYTTKSFLSHTVGEKIFAVITQIGQVSESCPVEETVSTLGQYIEFGASWQKYDAID